MNYPYRRLSIFGRAVNATVTIFVFAIGILDVISHGPVWVGVLDLVLVLINVALFCVATRVAGDRRARYVEAGRPRPDYRQIAAMEREVYGEVFHHDGATVPPARTPDDIYDGIKGITAEMATGDSGWIVPWGMWADTAGRFWLHPAYDVFDRPRGTVQMRVECRWDGFHVWPPAGEKYIPLASPGYCSATSMVYLPVASRHFGAIARTPGNHADTRS